MLHEHLNNENEVKTDENRTMTSHEREVLSFIIMMYIYWRKKDYPRE